MTELPRPTQESQPKAQTDGPRRVSEHADNFRYRFANAMNRFPFFSTSTTILLTEDRDMQGKEVMTSPLFEAERLVKEEGRGIVYVYNHFSQDDPFRVLGSVYLQSPILRQQPLISPLEIHQSEKYEWLLQWLEANTEGVGKPIVIKDTLRKYGVADPKDKEKLVYISKDGAMMRENEGFLQYISAARTAATHGEAVALPITAGRSPILYEDTVMPPSDAELGPLGALSKRIGPKGAKKVAVVFVAVGLNGVQDYSKRNGINAGRKGESTLTATVKLEEINAFADIFDTTVDEIGRAFLAQGVPQEYLMHNPNAVRSSKFDRIKMWISQHSLGSSEPS